MYKTIFCEMTFPRIDRPKLSAVSVATMNIRKIKDLSLAALRAARERSLILYNTGGCLPCSVFRNEFYISLALPISPEIMDGFWCSRCLNDRIEVPDMMRLFAGGATNPLVVKIWTKQLWVKIENSCNFDCNFALFTGKIWLWLFYNFFVL